MRGERVETKTKPGHPTDGEFRDWDPEDKEAEAMTESEQREHCWDVFIGEKGPRGVDLYMKDHRNHERCCWCGHDRK